jgi:hypothetical protein
MARIATGPIIADIRGKSGDQIFSRNKYGPYVKAFAVPTGTPSAAMETARERMAAIVAAWHGLSEANRQRWISQAAAMNAKAKRFPRETLTGYNLFTRCQMWRLTSGLSQSTTPSALLRIPTFQIVTTYEATSGIEGEYTTQNSTSAWRIMTYGSAGFEPSRYSPNVSPYKYVGSLNFDGNNNPSPALLSGDWPTVWDAEELPFGNVIFLKFRICNLSNGQQSPEIIHRVLIDTA